MRSTAQQQPFDLLERIEQRCLEAVRKVESGVQMVGRGSGLLAIRLRERLFTMPLAVIESIESVPTYTRVPGVQPWLLGIANLRGVVITVTDISAFLFGETRPRPASSRLIVAPHEGWQYGLLVDEIIGLRRFETAPLETYPEPDDTHLSRYVDQQRRVGGRVWLELNLHTVLQDQAFQNATLSNALNSD